MLMPESSRVSPTTGLMTKPHIIVSPGGSSEQLSYGTSEDEAWGDYPVPSPGKASAYIPDSPSRSPAKAPSPLPTATIPPPELPLTEKPPTDQQTEALIPPSTDFVPLVISLRSAQELSVPATLPAEAFAALPSSPSTLGVVVPSASSSPVSYTAVTPALVTSAATSSSSASPVSPVIIPSLLETIIGQLELMMKMTRDAVEAGQGNFEFFKPLLLNYLNNIEALGNAELAKRCSEGIARLEEDLKTLQDLNRVNLDAHIESAFADTRAQALQNFELLQQAFGEREAQAVSLRAHCDQQESELSTLVSLMQANQASITTIKDAIAQLQRELVRREGRLAQEKSAVENLTRENAETFHDYCEKVQTLEVMKEVLAAAMPDDETLRREATAAVQASHGKKVAEIKARLASISLPRPAT